MFILIVGILIFAGVHLVPSLAPGVRAKLLGRLGENGYKGLFSLALLAGIGLIVAGWRSTLPHLLYLPAAELRHVAMALIAVAFLLFVASGRASRLKSLVRHPQLTGVLVWALAHLLLNGDNRSVVLFGALAAWSLVEMIAINRREGAWVKPAPPPWSSEVVTVAITAVVIAATIFAHPWIAGVPVH